MQEDEVGSKGKVEEGKEEVTAEVIELVTGATDAEATDAEGAPSAADRSVEAPTAQSTSARACGASPRADR